MASGTEWKYELIVNQFDVYIYYMDKRNETETQNLNTFKTKHEKTYKMASIGAKTNEWK